MNRFAQFVRAERRLASITRHISPAIATFWFAGETRLADSARLVRRARRARFPCTVLPAHNRNVIVVAAQARKEIA